MHPEFGGESGPRSFVSFGIFRCSSDIGFSFTAIFMQVIFFRLTNFKVASTSACNLANVIACSVLTKPMCKKVIETAKKNYFQS